MKTLYQKESPPLERHLARNAEGSPPVERCLASSFAKPTARQVREAEKGSPPTDLCTLLGTLARQALIAEAELTPKPGLVDQRGSGANTDFIARHHEKVSVRDRTLHLAHGFSIQFTLIVEQAISGGFLTHGYQANRLLAFDDEEVLIHAMHKEPAARITRRTVAQLEELAKSVTPLSYNIRDYAKLGLL
jgi:hypothetical protein